ncbi:HPr family phosphocarrier protein [Clostridium sp. CM028]|uniref:HPr family phosphocarrier protein n=1 Tax=Clostridium TaxID=1485 RepID=UPI0013EED5CD|nr:MULTISPECIES: HPr family phosphocarrier protein [Clostridium]MBU3093880.1 HPr family phosphocarrier protein [Clostridium sp. CF011]MBW9147061.1 HPr family phosphocarrier protein [Clostridium sp. CM027]MBW9150457.1 HPr family phosphocarrier protein [Clostridium sp. CM028]MBZ9609811.1 HPr family phosphocarrier protein [Clostridium estertheticum]UVE39978.1 HPr family phosphocarrier protein [Clostridium sp. CM027]
MYEVEIVLMNEQGLHARPASIVAKKASKFTSHITLIKDEEKYNAKSIINILSMAATKGDKLKIVANGDDEVKAVEELRIVIEKEIINL